MGGRSTKGHQCQGSGVTGGGLGSWPLQFPYTSLPEGRLGKGKLVEQTKSHVTAISLGSQLYSLSLLPYYPF